MNNPWDVRPRQPQGDPTPDLIFHRIGYSLTVWEMLESQIGEMYDCLVSGGKCRHDSNRAGFMSFRSVTSSSARAQLAEAAVSYALKESTYRDRVSQLFVAVKGFGQRRNEIAHGYVAGLGEFGFYLVPNNTNASKVFTKGPMKGTVKYQYTAEDVDWYLHGFDQTLSECHDLIILIYRERAGPTYQCNAANCEDL